MNEEIRQTWDTKKEEAISDGLDQLKDKMVIPIVEALAVKIKDCVIDKINNMGQSNRKSLKTQKGRVIITSRGVLKTSNKWWLEDD